MDLHFIPFEGRFIVYRPLLPLAFLGNQSLVEHVKRLMDGAGPEEETEDVDRFLEEMGFWDDPPIRPWLNVEDLPVFRPTTATLLLTTDCNMRCIYCYARGGEETSLRMPRWMARRAIEEVYRVAKEDGEDGFSLAFHGGGEPTIHWTLLKESVNRVKEKDLPCHVSMSSNGLWNDEQTAFISAHFDGLSVSFDGLPEIQDAQRPTSAGEGSSKRVLETLKALDEAGTRYGIRMTVTPASMERLNESVSFLCEETSCPVMQVEPSYGMERRSLPEPSHAQAEEFVKAFMASYETAMKAGRILLYSGARPWLLTSSFCSASREALIVTPEGDVVNCFEVYGRQHPLWERSRIGRLTERGLHVEEERRRALKDQEERRKEKCRGCYCYWHCAGDCWTRCQGDTGRNEGRCEVNRAITLELLAWALAKEQGVWKGIHVQDAACQPVL